MPPTTPFGDLLTDQIGNEFAASHQYTAIAIWFDDRTLPKLAGHFYAQALEERNHAMMLVQYLLDNGCPVRIPGIAAPLTDFATVREPVALALEQERRVTDQISALARTARDQGDYLGEQFMQWFLKEQVEEVSTMSALLTIVDRAGDNLFHIEDFVAREMPARAGTDPMAPHPAGGGANLGL